MPAKSPASFLLDALDCGVGNGHQAWLRHLLKGSEGREGGGCRSAAAGKPYGSVDRTSPSGIAASPSSSSASPAAWGSRRRGVTGTGGYYGHHPANALDSITLYPKPDSWLSPTSVSVPALSNLRYGPWNFRCGNREDKRCPGIAGDTGLLIRVEELVGGRLYRAHEVGFLDFPGAALVLSPHFPGGQWYHGHT